MGETDEVRSYLEEGDTVDCLGVGLDVPVCTPLQVVCMGSRSPEVVKLLLEYGASVTFTGDTGSTPLALAAYEGCVDTVRLLLLYKADVNDFGSDADDLTPLEGCVMSDAACPLVASVLIEHGANVYRTGPDGGTVLDILHDNDMIEQDVEESIEAVIEVELVTRGKCAAFAMAHKERLGAESIVKTLPPDVMRVILLMV